MLFRPDRPFGRLLAEEIGRQGLTIIDEFVAQDSGLIIVPLVEAIHFE
ncbi:hypothetical protein HK44_007080 [Pseudomonas fluorescens HK44]|uniref:Uncharacterized protein n=1 Tax=Pseudomonas fluorescens HK44 TaxID=1042209 RepID=A0A010SMC9_PSEFL|nr:hypothetical protein HK44_007080 [Pseudomonas fluorescens HK44]